MKKTNADIENARLKAENAALKKENKNLSRKLDNSKSKKVKLQQELKKNDDRIIVLTKEQERSLSSQLTDINILNLL